MIRTSLTHDLTYFVNAWSHVLRQQRFSFIDFTVFLWLNIDQANTVNSFVYEKQKLTSFTVEPFNIYFEDLMWLFTHLCRLDKQDRRLKISLSWHLTSSLKTFTIESNIFNKQFLVLLVKIATHFWTITLHTRTFDSESFWYWNAGWR